MIGSGVAAEEAENASVRVGAGAEQQTDEISPPRSGGLVQRGATASVTGVDINAGLYQEAQGIRLLLRRARPFLRRARLHRLRDEEVQGPCPVGRAGMETVREQPLYPLHPCSDIGRKESIDQEAHRAVRSVVLLPRRVPRPDAVVVKKPPPLLVNHADIN